MFNERFVKMPLTLSGREDARTYSPVVRRSWYSFIKEPTEYCTALVLLVLTAPLIVCAMLAVKLTSRGPAVYSQVRFGRHGRPFAVYKIRSMKHDCEAQSGICWSTHGDPRVTPVGRFLRASHIDELPQFWNVLRGEMSLVGPRPERPEFVATLEKVVPRYRERLSVRPGLTGLAQIQLPADTDIDSVQRKLAHDLYHLENPSFSLEVRILAATVLKVLRFPYWVGRSLFALPGGEEVERAYWRSIRSVGDRKVVEESSVPAVYGDPVARLETV